MTPPFFCKRHRVTQTATTVLYDNKND